MRWQRLESAVEVTNRLITERPAAKYQRHEDDCFPARTASQTITQQVIAQLHDTD